MNEDFHLVPLPAEADTDLLEALGPTEERPPESQYCVFRCGPNFPLGRRISWEFLIYAARLCRWLTSQSPKAADPGCFPSMLWSLPCAARAITMTFESALLPTK